MKTSYYVEDIGDDEFIHYITYQEETKNYHTGAPVWCQIQEDSNWALHMMTYSAIYKSPNAVVLCHNVDAVSIRNPNSDFIYEANINIQYKDDLEYIGKYKLEDRIKVKGHPYTFYTEAREAIVIPEIKRNIIKREDYDENEYNTTFYDDVRKLMLTASFLITAYLAGSGKTWLLVSLFIDDGYSLFLVPTHEAKVNIQRTAQDQGKTIKNLFVIADFLTSNKTHSEQIFSLRRFKHIFIDEVFQTNKEDIKKLYEVKTKFGTKIFGAGAFDQIPAVDTKNDNYDLTDNHFFKDLLLDGHEIKLNYRQGYGRFKDNLHEDLIHIVDNGTLPERFKDQVANKDHYFHLTLTRQKRDELAQLCSKRYIKSVAKGGQMLTGQKRIIYHGWGYGVGMPLINYFNTKINKFTQNTGNCFKDTYALFKTLNAWKTYMEYRNQPEVLSNIKKARTKSTSYNYVIKNKYRYTIEDIHVVRHNVNKTKDIYMDLHCISTNEMLYNMPIHMISTLFQPFFASTIAGIQGARIEQPFSIWEMNLKTFNRNLLNSATGRSTCREHVHFSNTDTDHIYTWATFRKSVRIDERPCHNSNGYHETKFYLICYKGIPIYRGHTIQSIDEILKEHWGDAKRNATNKFHKFLINQNPDDIEIVRTETKKINNQQEAEDYEMTLLKEDLMNGHKMLNTKKRTRRMNNKSPIPLTTNQKQLTLERFQEIQSGKLVKKNTFNPTVNHSEKRQSIIVYYRLDNKKKEKEFRYKKIGYEKALEEANKYVE